MALRPDLVVIPARLGSQRLRGKALAEIEGIPMVERVRRRVVAALPGVRVVVACDGREIAECIHSYGGESSIVTQPSRSGSDRAAALLPAHPEAQLILNVQCDEAGIDTETLDAFLGGTVEQPEADIWTPVVATDEAAEGVYAVGSAGRALYFSRAVIPVERSGSPCARWLHRGLYLYRRSALEEFHAAAACPLEEAERLEQLRALALGLHIALVPVPDFPRAVDTAADLARWQGVTG